MPRHQFGGNARHPRSATGSQPRVSCTALFPPSHLFKHPGEPQERSRPHRRILAFRQYTVDLRCLGRLCLQEFEDLSLGKEFNRGFRIFGGRGIVEQPAGRVRRHGALFQGQEHTVFRLARRGANREPGAYALTGFRQRSAQGSGDSVGGLFQPLLPPLRLHHAVLFQQFVPKPAYGGYRHETQQDQNEKQALRWSEPLP